MTELQKDDPIRQEAILREIGDSIGTLRYGEVHIKVHGGRIVQMEITDKKRFDHIWKMDDGAGI